MRETIRTLYVEGERGAGRASAEALESAGPVLLAEDGLDALRRLRDEDVDCVVCAGALPRLSVTTFVRRTGAAADDPPVVLYGDDPERAIEGLRAGAAGYVPDGLNAREALLDRVREAVDEERTRRALDRHRRLEALSFEVLRGAVSATTRAGSETAIQSAFAEADLYRSAWLGEHDPESDVLALSEPVEGELATDALADAGDPVRRALADGGVVCVSSGLDAQRTLGVVPLADRNGAEAVLLLGSDDGDAFDRAERALLGDLGEALASALRRSGAERSSAPSDDRRFAAGLAHDLRSLVGVVSTQLDLARESEAPAALDRAERAIERVDRTVENVLAVAGDDSIDEPVAEDLATDAETAWDRVDGGSADLRIEDPPTIRADHDAVVRLLANLFRNALEHGRTEPPTTGTGDASANAPGAGADAPGGDESRDAPGTGADATGATPGAADDPHPTGPDRDDSEAEGVTVRVGGLSDGFFVADDGPGIPEAERDRVFEWGYTTSASGTGIGLAVVREIAEAHGWDVRITESEDGGARFEFRNVDVPAASFEWGGS